MSYQLNEVRNYCSSFLLSVTAVCRYSSKYYLIMSRFDDVYCHVAFTDDIYNLIMFNNNFFGAVEEKILRVINESPRDDDDDGDDDDVREENNSIIRFNDSNRQESISPTFMRSFYARLLRAAFTHADPKSPKKTVNSSSFLRFRDLTERKSWA